MRLVISICRAMYNIEQVYNIERIGLNGPSGGRFDLGFGSSCSCGGGKQMRKAIS
jgi:hypothetical protein